MRFREFHLCDGESGEGAEGKLSLLVSSSSSSSSLVSSHYLLENIFYNCFMVLKSDLHALLFSPLLYNGFVLGTMGPTTAREDP